MPLKLQHAQKPSLQLSKVRSSDIKHCKDSLPYFSSLTCLLSSAFSLPSFLPSLPPLSLSPSLPPSHHVTLPPYLSLSPSSLPPASLPSSHPPPSFPLTLLPPFSLPSPHPPPSLPPPCLSFPLTLPASLPPYLS